MLCTGFLGICATDDVRTIIDRALRVEGTLLARETLNQELGVGTLR